MFRQTLYLISKSFYQWIHPNYEQNTKISIEILALVIFKAQEIAIVFDKNITRNPEMRLLAGFSKLTFISQQDSFYYYTILICIFFIIHVSYTLLITLNILKKQLANYLFSYTILHFYLTYYSYIIYIPVLYSSLKIFHEIRECNNEEFCNKQNSFFLLFIGICNIISCITIKIIHILYARASSIIMGDSNILQLKTPIYQNLIQEILVFISIFFINYNENNLIGLILICIKQSLSIINQLDKINCQFYVLFKVFSIYTIISIYFVLETCEYFLITLFFVSVMKIILERIKFQNLFDQNSDSLIKIQIIENSIVNQNHIIQILLLKLHNCQHCYKPQQMSGCIFQKLLSKNNDLEQQLLYCQYISECYPLKALIKILSVQSNDIYFNGAKLNLIEILTLKVKEYQEKIKMFKNS